MDIFKNVQNEKNQNRSLQLFCKNAILPERAVNAKKIMQKVLRQFFFHFFKILKKKNFARNLLPNVAIFVENWQQKKRKKILCKIC
jgi:hypothetical protein